jgi:hypothetical protein
VSRSTVNTKNDKSGLPLIVLESPHISITILRARHNSVRFGCPINSGNNLVMLG